MLGQTAAQLTPRRTSPTVHLSALAPKPCGVILRTEPALRGPARGGHGDEDGTGGQLRAEIGSPASFHALAPAWPAARTRPQLALATSAGCCSQLATQRTVWPNRCRPPMIAPMKASSPPTPTSMAPTVRGPTQTALFPLPRPISRCCLLRLDRPAQLSAHSNRMGLSVTPGEPRPAQLVRISTVRPPARPKTTLMG